MPEFTVTTPLHDADIPDHKHPHMVIRNGRLHCSTCRQGSQYLHISRSFTDPGRSNQYATFALQHSRCRLEVLK